MTFQIKALPYAPFADLFALADAALAARSMRRVFADTNPGFPCRVSLQDANIGEEMLLLNYQHLQGHTPYAASHAIYVRKNAEQAEPLPDHIPVVLANRLLSVRAFDADQQMVMADVTDGKALGQMLTAVFALQAVAFIHIHNAKQGCFAASAIRA